MDLKLKISNMKTLLDKTIDYRSENSFRFYVPRGIGKPSQLEDACRKGTTPTLLAGEIIITEAHTVVMYHSIIDKGKCVLGDLFVTNFRVFFVPIDGCSQIGCVSQKNHLIGEYGTCLSNIDAIYHVDGDRSRRLQPNTTVPRHVKALQIVCKNMRVFNFSFEQCCCDHWSNVVKTILHHSFPGRHSLLFAYECSESVTGDDVIDDVVMFNDKEDWECELRRNYPDNTASWQLTEMNKNHSFTRFLPEWVIVPKSIVDSDLQTVSNAFRYNRLPTWTWSYRNGAALVRLSLLLPGVIDRTQENRILEKIRASHPSVTPPEIIELDKCLPCVKDINISFLKLRELCIPDGKRLKEQDSKFYALLDNTKWLSHVSACLREGVKSVQHIQHGVTVVLQEGDGRDTSAVVASLIQLMMDASTRSIRGFQSLIQKEWVALAHPFSSRLGHVHTTDREQEKSPVFLLFLDCVWQLQNQFPTTFEFTETYLTTLYDSSHISLFETFLFDCEKERLDAVRSSEVRFRRFSVWNWKKQFTDSDIALFYNPLYLLEQIPVNRLSSRPKLPSPTVIFPNCGLPFLEPWAQCYFRWHPSLGIRGGGRPLVDSVHRSLRCAVDELSKASSATFEDLQRISSIANYSMDKRKSVSADSLLGQSKIPDNFFPFSCVLATSATNFLADSSTFSEFDSQSVLNLTD